MSHKANLILASDTGYNLFYCHWCGNHLPEEVFWGPAYTLLYISGQRPVEKDEWQDELWAEGGVILDTHRKTLFLYARDRWSDIFLRRLYLELLQEVWEGWTVRWAYEGVLEFADYMGVPRDKLRYVRGKSLVGLSLKSNPNQYLNHTVGSVRFEDGQVRLYPLGGQLDWFLSEGPSILQDLRQEGGLINLVFEDWFSYFPRDGFYIDTRKQEVAFWSVHTCGFLDQVISAWPGWEVKWLKDNVEYQVFQMGGQLVLPVESSENLLTQLEKVLLSDSMQSGLDMVLKDAAERFQQGHEVYINPHALSDNPLGLKLEARRQIFDKAVTAWKARQPSA